ncbi:MAG TPA: TetR/AcrR family transcriptional regulator [Galbitalea sp.]|jgi:AcrR family transcriptional regulator|nr:TetR/AcrR family transcriptional regulator [Galbitalea sp.]
MSEKSARRSPRPADRLRDPERTRAAIIDAATKEFAAHGYAGARVSTIASRAGVNQQLISYYFDGKEGLARAIAERWRDREDDLVAVDTPFPEQIRRYALEALNNPENVRLLAWSGLEYSGPDSDPDFNSRSERLTRNADQVRALLANSDLPEGIDPSTLMVMLMGAAMAPIFLPQVIRALGNTDATSEEFLRSYADQVAQLTSAVIGEPRKNT